jgi:UDP-galactopyranose mutase
VLQMIQGAVQDLLCQRINKHQDHHLMNMKEEEVTVTRIQTIKIADQDDEKKTKKSQSYITNETNCSC